MLAVDRVTIREDWQRAIVERDITRDEQHLALLEREPDNIPVRCVYSADTLGAERAAELDRSLAVSAMANLLYLPAVPFSAQREAKLLAEWPAQAEEARRLLRRELRIKCRALAEYDRAEA